MAKLCKSMDLHVIEDANEAFSGLRYHGSPQADLTMFSFGMLKHFTAFGGSVSIVRSTDGVVYQRMREIEKTYRKEENFKYFTRVMKALRLFMIFNSKDHFFISFI